MDLINIDEIMRMTGLGWFQAKDLFKENDFPWFYNAPRCEVERNQFITWWTRRCLKQKGETK